MKIRHSLLLGGVTGLWLGGAPVAQAQTVSPTVLPLTDPTPNSSTNTFFRNPEVYAARGTAFLVVGQAPNAYSDLSQAIAQNPTPTNPELFFNRGMVRARLGDSLGARLDFEQAANLYLQQGNAIGYRQTLDQMRSL